MLSEIHKAKQMLEGSIAGFLNEAANIQTEDFRGKHIVFWSFEETNGQFEQVKKQGTIEEVLIDVDVYENFFISIAFKLTGGSTILLEEVEEIR